ncbi:DUF397 domain-containing protein [Streptomyces albidoflavus]|uniref:DUF397 domain-containing protein n=1 Tax=Streptomyces albidoflavus TaxID=1886 RepID=UPI001020F5D1|nr:DUF397 domain-containing protein [Streptomyces albidoflavus]RZE59646.1 DUF397 domain-containing protein [Streptomyces albidoflavus]
MTEPPRWFASSYSGGDGGQCVEWAPAHALATGEFLVRDSKVQNGPHLTLSRESFAGLVALARARG